MKRTKIKLGSCNGQEIQNCNVRMCVNMVVHEIPHVVKIQNLICWSEIIKTLILYRRVSFGVRLVRVLEEIER